MSRKTDPEDTGESVPESRDNYLKRRRFLAATGAVAGTGVLAGCLNDEEPVDDDPDDDDDDPDVEPDTVEPRFEIPYMVEADGTPVYDGSIDFHSYTSVKHGLYMSGALARGSEFGHENYNPELTGDYMRERGETWNDMIEDILDTFWEDGEIATELEETEDGWVRSDEVSLADYMHGVYAYQTHHRGGRWEGEGHQEVADGITFGSGHYISRYGEYLFDEHYSDGRFYHDTDHEEFDTESMAYGLSGTPGLAYAWTRWSSPAGEGDMANVDEGVMEAFLGYTPEELVEIYRDVGQELEEAWDDEVGAYDFGDGTEYAINTLGPLLHGNKAAYETLAIFGEDEDTELAESLAENTATMLEPIVTGDVAEPWGLPTHVEYTEDGVEAAADEVDIGLHWVFIKHITGGWSLTRESEDENSPQFLTENEPELMEALNEFKDEQILGALDHHLDDEGIAVTAVDYETGDITDDSYTADALGMFLTGIGSIYRSHEAVARARDWDEIEDEELLEQSEEFHDIYVENSEFLMDNFVVQA